MIKSYILSTAVIMSAVLFLLSCEKSQDRKTLAASKGLPSELLLVVDKELWNTDLQDSVKLITESPVPGIAQAENFFRVTQIFTKFYDRSFYTFHSKLFVHIDKSLSKPFVGVNHNVSARPQIEVTVSAPSIDAMRDYLFRNKDMIQELIADAQIDMRVANLKKYSKKVDDDLRNILSMTIRVPENIIATKKGKDFLWGGSNLQQKDLNIVIYTYPWEGENVLTEEYFAHKRDSVMRINIPGKNDEQWMQTTRENEVPVVLSQIKEFNGKKVLVVRGLWEMRNAPIGGPFVSIARIDTAQNRVVVSEGFVYSPSTEKRELLRTLEASLRTLKDCAE